LSWTCVVALRDAMIGMEAPPAPPKLIEPFFWLTSGTTVSLMKPRALTCGVTLRLMPIAL